MSITLTHIISGAAIGIGASVCMDVWNLFLKRAFNIPSLNYCLLGRWVLHMPEGTFFHSGIAASPPKKFECAAGWIAHYSIGVMLALVFVVLAPSGWLAQPTLLPALLFGVATVVFPLFFLQPALGLGVASSKTPKPLQARMKSVMTHVVFGVGLYLCAALLSRLPL